MNIRLSESLFRELLKRQCPALTNRQLVLCQNDLVGIMKTEGFTSEHEAFRVWLSRISGAGESLSMSDILRYARTLEEYGG
jgi:hypothetical protein